MIHAETPKIQVEADNDGINLSAKFSWRDLRRMAKPLGLLLTHLATAGITWFGTVQNLPALPVQPTIETISRDAE